MILDYTDYRQILNFELEKRQKFNSSYSLRAFARDLMISPSRVSEVLSGKQGLSLLSAKKIAKQLQYNKCETEYFVDLVLTVHARSKLEKDSARIRLSRFKKTSEREMALNVFEIISRWEHFAIMEVLQLKNAKSNSSWISEKLNLSQDYVDECIRRLLKVGLLVKENKKLKRVDDSLFIWPSDVSSDSIKNYHKNVQLKSLEVLYLVPLEKREYSSVIMPVNKRSLPEIKKLIKDFTLKLNKVVTEENDFDDVYYFSSQFFPITFSQNSTEH